MLLSLESKVNFINSLTISSPSEMYRNKMSIMHNRNHTQKMDFSRDMAKACSHCCGPVTVTEYLKFIKPFMEVLLLIFRKLHEIRSRIAILPMS